jgi:hypothetical protein
MSTKVIDNKRKMIDDGLKENDNDDHSMIVGFKAPTPKFVMAPDFETRFKTAVFTTENKILGDEIATFQRLRARSRKLPDPELECPFIVSMCWAIHKLGDPNRVIQLFGNNFANFFKLSWLPVMSTFIHKPETNANTIIVGMADLLFGNNFMTGVANGWGTLFREWSDGIDKILTLIGKAHEAKVDKISESDEYFRNALDKNVIQTLGKFPKGVRDCVIKVCGKHKIDIPDPDQLSIKDH